MIEWFFSSPVDKLIKPRSVFRQQEFPDFCQKCVLEQNGTVKQSK